MTREEAGTEGKICELYFISSRYCTRLYARHTYRFTTLILTILYHNVVATLTIQFFRLSNDLMKVISCTHRTGLVIITY